ncbi:hypothetical protein [Methanoculleus sp.]|jgi:hypothetical protein|uniref:hypothetical protein n=1 Tax=Methanoculleus sp. TaxID=90427 RepID=UPI000CAAE3EF|nr:hypothetical protein [Methanoculleus sp.]MCK9319366.1 hypothetical protein [Methanoculleus sp.]PKP53739.1 MAG: hypothetical protein CVT92_02040 [Bacteroidetes bacterium HGW-Bacteroidetes-1]
MNNLESYISTIDNNSAVVKGELYKLQNNKVKKAGLVARKALMAIIKSAHAMRKLIQADVAAMPIVKKNITPEKLKEMAAKRQITFNEKKAKRLAALKK